MAVVAGRSRRRTRPPRSRRAAWLVLPMLAGAALIAPQFADAEGGAEVAPTPTAVNGPASGAPPTDTPGADALTSAASHASCLASTGAPQGGGFQPAVRLDQPAPTVAPPGCTSGPIGGQPPTAPAPSPGTCGVSALLVPACGAWLGAATTDAALKYDYAVGLAEYEAVAQNTPDIQHFYRSGGAPFPTRTHRALSERPGHQRSLLLINWKPSTSLTWRQVADGAADHLIESAAAGMRDYPYRFYLTIWHEPENDFGPGSQPSDYVAMYRHVVAKLRSVGVTNAVYVWNMMGYSGHGHLYDSLYPGHDVVDWIAWDPYSSKGTTFGQLVNENCCRVRNWTGFYDWAVRMAPGKPLMLAEWGFNLLENPNGPAALDQGVATLRTQFPALKALVYWNENRVGHYRIDASTPLGQAYGQAYQRFANDAYFNSTSTASAP